MMLHGRLVLFRLYFLLNNIFTGRVMFWSLWVLHLLFKNCTVLRPSRTLPLGILIIIYESNVKYHDF